MLKISIGLSNLFGLPKEQKKNVRRKFAKIAEFPSIEMAQKIDVNVKIAKQ